MKRTVFLLDENTPHAIGDQVRRRNPEVRVHVVGVDPAPPLGTLDPDILLWLEAEDVTLVTRNRRSMPRHLDEHLRAGHSVPGIYVIRRQASLGAVIADLLLIWSTVELGEHRNQIIYLPV
jgi:hypothetical protein